MSHILSSIFPTFDYSLPSGTTLMRGSLTWLGGGLRRVWHCVFLECNEDWFQPIGCSILSIDRPRLLYGIWSYRFLLLLFTYLFINLFLMFLYIYFIFITFSYFQPRTNIETNIGTPSRNLWNLRRLDCEFVLWFLMNMVLFVLFKI